MGEIIGAVISVLSLSAGYSLGRLRRKTYQPKQIKLKCGCGHELAYHDKDTSKCHGTNYGDHYNGKGDWISNRRPCTCRQYDGPVPYDTYVAREIA